MPISKSLIRCKQSDPTAEWLRQELLSDGKNFHAKFVDPNRKTPLPKKTEEAAKPIFGSHNFSQSSSRSLEKRTAPKNKAYSPGLKNLEMNAEIDSRLEELKKMERAHNNLLQTQSSRGENLQIETESSARTSESRMNSSMSSESNSQGTAPSIQNLREMNSTLRDIERCLTGIGPFEAHRERGNLSTDSLCTDRSRSTGTRNDDREILINRQLERLRQCEIDFTAYLAART